jgi:hypothetical protein
MLPFGSQRVKLGSKSAHLVAILQRKRSDLGHLGSHSRNPRGVRSGGVARRARGTSLPGRSLRLTARSFQAAAYFAWD